METRKQIKVQSSAQISNSGKIKEFQKSKIKFLLKQHVNEKWQKKWDDLNTRSPFAHTLVSKVYLKRIWPNDVVSQLVTNHGAFSVSFRFVLNKTSAT